MNILQKIFGFTDPFEVNISQEDLLQLCEIRANHSDPKVKLRANIVLQKFRNKSRTAMSEICNSLDLPEWTVSRIIKSYQEFGIEGLVPCSRDDY